MARLVYYHHPQAENFSLSYSSDSPADLLTRQNESDRPTKLMGYPFADPVYVLYEGDSGIEVASDVDLDGDWLIERIRELPRAGEIVAFQLVELFEAAADVRKADEFRLYKEFEPQKIQRALEHVSWGASLPTVAGELMSNLILRHSLPNANHRTSIAMLQFCIESIDPEFEMPHVRMSTMKRGTTGLTRTSSTLSACSQSVGTTSDSSDLRSWASTSSNGRTELRFDLPTSI